MLIEHLVGKRIADAPKDAQTPGHRLLLRGGYIRQVGQGIYTLLPLAHRVCQRVEAIIREEMNRVGGQELLMPVVSPAELWEESGRYQTVGSEMLRFTDRNDHPCVLNMTHEEVIVDAVRANIDSYRQFPFLVYQIQTKFRDEPRSRGGLIRVREFTMKDGYSFHRTDECLDKTYHEVHKAYTRIFKRVGLRRFIDIESDTGMMGGSVAHEFMLVSDVGEDTLVLCSACDYRANREVARSKRVYESSEAMQPLTNVETPGQKTIDEVTTFLKSDARHACKAVAFMAGEKPVVAFVRGDFDVNLAKLKRALRTGDVRPMEDSEFASFGSVAGFVGPLGVDTAKVTLLFDESVAQSPNLIIGANAVDLHTTGFNFTRDLPAGTPVHDLTDVNEGDPCPCCGKPLSLERGIEIGNIFQLGKKYTAAMRFEYSEEDGSLAIPTMGCYGIGVGRTMASVVEESNDKYGPIWPISIAPFQVQVCCLGASKDPSIADVGRKVYDDLRAAGIETLFDARAVGAGFMFADADLIGAPLRVIVSPRNQKKGVAELKYRVVEPPADLPAEAPLDNLIPALQEILARLAAPFAAS
ncbi:MAG: prolyl-tRNA synthetase [Candidatus Sumerlaeota bacterium]|nr:prolyl-tRNA synthetase [Candidatus Sumerlaeota bacterium]